ncbi:MAG TPA: hypothetical protein VHC63_15150 [Acidimicrobiales bacterium]|nr:hypothetical protein [Acidimicrobiales bacterium]
MRKVLILVASVALLGGACKSGGGDTASTTTIAEAATTTTAASGEAMQAKALAAADLPPGYNRVSLDVDKNDTTPMGCAAIDNVDEQFQKSIVHSVEASFQNGDDTTTTQFVDEQVTSLGSADVAKNYFDAESAGISACTTFSHSDTDGTRTSGEIATYAFPKIADGSVAAALSGTVTNPDGSSATLGGPIVMVRKGAFIVQLTFLHLGNAPGLTGNDVINVAQKAADKV